MGNSVNCENIRENTIASLQKAYEHGADFVEFDVQLSKDLIPVIFHDFFVKIGLNKKFKKGGGLTALSLPVKDLTLAQLHELKEFFLFDFLNSLSNDSNAQTAFIAEKNEKLVSHFENPNATATVSNEEDDQEEPFPTLEHALSVVDPHVGFNVELKWPLQLKDGSWELDNPFELNLFVDIVLDTCLRFGGQRKIVFSCFHPDICLMIRYKQNKFPILFLTQGVSQKYPEYSDPRTQSIPIAIYFALNSGILGLSIHSEDILRDPSQIKEVISHGLIAFCWGEDNNNAQTIKYLKELGMNGIIYDRIDDHISKIDKKGIFFLESQEELLQIAASANLMSPSPASPNGNGCEKGLFILE